MQNTRVLLIVGLMILIEILNTARSLNSVHSKPYAVHWVLLILLTVVLFVTMYDVPAVIVGSNAEMDVLFNNIMEALDGLGFGS